MSEETSQNYRVLARKYRPLTFASLIGQEAMVRTLGNAFALGRIAHAFVLTGVRGVGKTTTARIIAKALNCQAFDKPTITPCGECEDCLAIVNGSHVDVMEMDAASRTGVGDIRELIESVRYRPVMARYKVYIIDEVHMLSLAAFNALLKTLEEPPEHVKFIFATTEIRKIPVTVLSRCQRFDLRRVESQVLAQHFARVSEQEGSKIEPEGLQLIARAADGSVRDGLSLLDQAIARGGENVSAELVKEMLGFTDKSAIFDLFKAVMEGQLPEALRLAAGRYASGADPMAVIEDLLEVTHEITRAKLVPDAAKEAELAPSAGEAGRKLAQSLSVAVLARAWQMLLKGLQEARISPSPFKALEMILIRLCYVADLPPPGEIAKMAREEGSSGPARTFSPPSPPRGGNLALAQPIAAVAAPGPRNFEQVVALFGEKKEFFLQTQLKTNVHLVRCEPGILEFRPTPDAPNDLSSKCAQLLRLWTGKAWLVSIRGDMPVKPTLYQEEKARLSAAENEALQHPLVKGLLDAFPGIELKVKPIIEEHDFETIGEEE